MSLCVGHSRCVRTLLRFMRQTLPLALVTEAGALTLVCIYGEPFECACYVITQIWTGRAKDGTRC